jgi:hypothetical protein
MGEIPRVNAVAAAKSLTSERGVLKKRTMKAVAEAGFFERNEPDA